MTFVFWNFSFWWKKNPPMAKKGFFADLSNVVSAGHSISVNEDHPAQGLAVDPLYFRISILPRWQIPDQHESRTRPLRFTQNLTHVFLWICALICIFFIESCSYWNKIWRNESILTKIGLFYLFGINFSSWILKNNAQLKQKCSLHSHFF